MAADARATGRPRLFVVLGMHRSGTSAVARGLQVLGVPLGDHLEPPAAGVNDKGYWEDIDLVTLNVEMLDAVGREWHSLEPVDAAGIEFLCQGGYLQRAVDLLRAKLAGRSSFGFKDPRTARLLPFWLRVFATSEVEARFVIVLRNPLSVVKSLTKRDAFEPEVSFLLWTDHLLSCLAHRHEWPTVLVDYDALLQDPERQWARVAASLGATIDQHELVVYRDEFLDLELRHSEFRPGDLQLDSAAPRLAREIYAFLLATLQGEESLDGAKVAAKVTEWTDEFDRLRPLIRLADKQRRQLAARDRTIADLDVAAATLRQRIGQAEQTVLEGEGRIAALQQDVLDRERAIAEREARVAELGQQVASLAASMADRDALYNQRTVGLEAAIAARESTNAELSRHAAALERLVIALRASASWRLTLPLRFLARQATRAVSAVRLLPRAVRLGGGVPATVKRTVQVFAQEGLGGVRARLRLAETPPPRPPEPVAEVRQRNSLGVRPYYVDPRVDAAPPAHEVRVTVAVHLHLCHGDMLERTGDRLRNIPCSFDLFVSVPQTVDRVTIAQRLRGMLPRVAEVVVENVPDRGRDLAPLIVQFGKRLTGYHLVGHFHSGKSGPGDDLQDGCGDLLDCLLECLLGDSGSTGGRVAHILHLLQNEAKVVFSEGRNEILEDETGWADNHAIAQQILDRHTRISIADFPRVEFPEGGMFWARVECLRPLLELPLRFADFPAEPMPVDGTLAHALKRLVLVLASPFPGQCIRLHRRDSVDDYRCHEPQQDFSGAIRNDDIKVLSYYLPQFHPIPENDAWHGTGFTEWTKVRAANPLFVGHYQQHIPHPDIGYYLLDTPDTFRMQAEMMRRAGVYGQVFYHYWFGGKLILEKPARMLLEAPDVPMRYCFCWANENWTRRWDGNEREILLAQDYSVADARAFIRYLIPFFQDPRYIRIDDRPVLFIYRPSSIPDMGSYLEAWASECAAAGLPRPYVVAVLTRGATHPAEFGMDAGVERVLHDWTAGNAPEIKANLQQYEPIQGSVLAYQDVQKYYRAQADTKDFTYFRSVVPMWDNTPRYGKEAYIVHGSTPDLFQDWLESAVDHARRTLPADRRIVLVNAWNEWAEGAHLEPDTRHGYSYLNSIGRALAGVPYGWSPALRLPSPVGQHVHLVLSPQVREELARSPELAKRFHHGLSRATVFATCHVTVDDARLAALLPRTVVRGDEGAGFVLEIRRIAFCSPVAIERMLEMALANPGSVVIANGYDGNRPLTEVTRNGSVDAAAARAAPLVVRPATPPPGGCKNFRMRTDAHAFVAQPHTVEAVGLPKVTVIIRFHRSGNPELLRNALCCLAAMQDCIAIPSIAAQDLDAAQAAQLQELLDDLPWAEGGEPQIVHYRSAGGTGDLRSTMLNESLRRVGTRYAAFLDYDDLVMSHAYAWLIARLRNTGKGVTFGRVYCTTYDSATGLRLERKRTYEYGYSYDEFVGHNHAPLHSFLLDVSKLDVHRTIYHEDQRYMEDYYLTLQLFTRENGDWASLAENFYIGDYIHSVDRSHTLAFSNEADRQAMQVDPEYQRCEQRISDMRTTVATR